ncbi:sodium-dependent bicarbonate transport family permease [Blastopirellula marina]|uniref:Sodium-dependent bicarbonate transport family permease n=2 Tax=Blastopirellula marina TaxID=124 RepID=A0A2S8GF46_9BACT|nr:sodium-dependent bicarbonate transport family permease [Blastopirellula marina]PTL46637.1 sodium-dependent bicarbonate transport family permease [Blastopirellula marina]
MLSEIASNFVSNLFQPLLLFFFMGFAIPLLRVPFEFPKALYQSLTIYLLVAIGWHGGELMAELPSSELAVAGGLAAVGFIVNGIIGVSATWLLRVFTPMRRIDAVTVGSYYGSDSAGTFVTCLGILAALSIHHDSYMPVMLAVMEIPGCLVGLTLISRLRRSGMDKLGNMPDEPGYLGDANALLSDVSGHGDHAEADEDSQHGQPVAKSVGAATAGHKSGGLNLKIFHEVFLNPGLYMLFGGIIVGFISGLQAYHDPHVVEGPNNLFLTMFKGALCLFLLEMGITACQRLSDLKTAGIGFILFGVLAPVLFATFGMCCLHAYSLALGHHFEEGTYALFAVLCGAASYIAVPAVQRIAIPEASPTLPLAASLGLTFTWNVTLGIPIYIQIAKTIITTMPVAG